MLSFKCCLRPSPAIRGELQARLRSSLDMGPGDQCCILDVHLHVVHKESVFQCNLYGYCHQLQIETEKV